MYIEIKEIGPEGLVVDRQIPCRLPPPRPGEDEIKVGMVHLSGELHKESSGIAFSGEIETRANLTCGRCLEAFDLPLDLQFDLLYTTRQERSDRKEARVDEETITEVHLESGRIDLNDLLAEQIFLGLPLKPLCREGCLGLCQVCGTNLNTGTCACQTERGADPRLAPLKKLL